MSKKDYEKIAAVLLDVMPPMLYKSAAPGEYSEEQIHAQIAARNMWCSTVATMAQMLATDNPRFNRARFYNACGITS